MNAIVSILLLATAAPVPAVQSVVVFPDRAQVTRVTKIECGARALATFEGIPPAADPATFRAKVSDGVVDGLRFEERTRREAFNAEVRNLEADLHKLDVERGALSDAIGRDAQTR